MCNMHLLVITLAVFISAFSTTLGLVSNKDYSLVASCFDPLSTPSIAIFISRDMTAIGCAVSCSSNSLCRSFSFMTEGDRRTCYLNHVTIDDSGCQNQFQHFKLLNIANPECNDHGVFVLSKSKCECHDGYIGSTCDRLMRDCSEGFKEDYYHLKKGLYYSQPSPSQPPFRAFCDMRNEGRSRIMAKGHNFPYVNFSRNWYDYKHGFGDFYTLQTEKRGTFWIGNEMLHHVTNSRRQTLIVEANIPGLGYRQYFYYGFVVKSEEEAYAFTYDRGAPSDHSPLGDILLVNGTKFSTYDVDNDLSADNCAAIHQSEWWFTTCGGYNPVGQPQPLSDKFVSSDPTSLSWPIAGNLSIPYLKMFLTHGLVEIHG